MFGTWSQIEMIERGVIPKKSDGSVASIMLLDFHTILARKNFCAAMRTAPFEYHRKQITIRVGRNRYRRSVVCTWGGALDWRFRARTVSASYACHAATATFTARTYLTHRK